MKKLIPLMLLLTASTVAAADTSYLCISDYATGFKFDRTTKKWGPAQFNVKDQKYLLSLKGAQWTWKDFGAAFGMDCSPENAYGLVRCNELELVTFNRRSLRFIKVYPVGYATPGSKPGEKPISSEGADTPSMEIGTCSQL